MPKIVKSQQCKCSNEILDELRSMKQTFMKIFKRLSQEVTLLRKEVKCSKNLNVEKFSVNKISSTDSNKSLTRRRKSQRLHQTINDNDGVLDLEMEMPMIKTENDNFEKGHSDEKCPMIEFMEIHTHILPMVPFSKIEEFEDWDTVLKIDEDQRDLLRIELLQEEYQDSEEYIKDIWKKVLTKNLTKSFALRANTKLNKKNLKNFVFTSIFKECFYQRFEDLKSNYFLDTTMKYFGLNRKLKSSSHPKFIDDDGDDTDESDFEDIEDEGL